MSKNLLIIILIILSASCSSSEEEPIIEPLDVDFTVSDSVIVSGESIEFRYQTSDHPVKREWIFDGGNPEKSDILVPSSQYSTPGVYTVSLAAESAEGGQGMMTKDDFIIVHEPLSGLMAHYTFDNNIDDELELSGTGYAHSYSLLPDLVEDRFNNIHAAIEFSNYNHQLIIEKSSELKQLKKFSISTWVKAGALEGRDTQRWILKSINAQPNFDDDTGYSVSLRDEQLQFRVGNNSISIPYVFNEWVHIVCSYNNGIKKIFLDGELKAEGEKRYNDFDEVAIAEDEPLELGIGSYFGSSGSIANEPFDGIIDDLKIFNRDLRALEIKLLYELEE